MIDSTLPPSAAGQIEARAEAALVALPQIIPTLPVGPFLLQDGKGSVMLLSSADALEAETGLRAFAAMDNEPAIASSDFLLRAITLATGYALGTAIEEPGKGATAQQLADYALAEEMRLYMERAVARLVTPLMGVLDAMVGEGWGDGHKLFEKVRGIVEDDDGSTQIQTVAIKPKPRELYRMHVTRNMDLLGATPGNGGLLNVGPPTTDQAPAFVPSDDLLVFSLRGKNGDPRGRGAKRAAYDGWYRKQQAKPEAMRHASLFGSGRISVEGPEPVSGATYPTKVRVAGKDLDLVDFLNSQMAGLSQGSYVVLTGGYRLKVHNPAGTGEAFELVFDRCDREMVLAYLTVTRTTLEAKHGSKADSETAESLLAHLVNYLRVHACEAIRDQYFIPDCALKYGERLARRFAPRLVMATVEQEDIAALLTALAAARLSNGVITDEQMPYWDKRLGQPERDLDETEGSDEEKDSADPPAEDDPKRPATFAAPRVAIANRAAQRRLQGTGRTAHRRFRSAVQQLVKGRIGEDEFKDRFAKGLQAGHQRAYEIGYRHGGGGDSLSSVGEEHVATVVASEGAFASDLASGLASGDKSLAQGLLASRRYANRLRGTANEAFREASEGKGLTFDWELGATEAHCSECPRYAEMSPWEPDELPTTPGAGDTECRSNCDCGLSRSDGKRGFGPIDFDQ